MKETYNVIKTAKTRVLNPLFEKQYPYPTQLTAPLRDPAYGFRYDYFANFHATRNACQIAVRVIRGRYCVCCRGWLPKRHLPDQAISYNQSWTVLTQRRYVDDAIDDFVYFARELFTMSDDELDKFSAVSRLLSGMV